MSSTNNVLSEECPIVKALSRKMKGLQANLRQPGDSGQLAHGGVCIVCNW